MNKKMSNKKQFFEKFKEVFSERKFDPNETLKWLTLNKLIAMSWGLQNPTNMMNSGLLFQVNGNYHKGYVLITLAGNDTYTVRFFSFEYKEVKETIKKVYCDELQNIIDIEIEKKE